MRVAKLIYGVEGRVARPAGVRTNIVKTVIQSLTMWFIFFLAAPTIVYRAETLLGLGRYRLHSPMWKAVGIMFFAAGWVLAWASAIFMVVHGEGTPLPVDAPRKFVCVGPYRYVRNPMALGSIVQGIGVGLYRRSPLVVAYAVLGALSWNYIARPWEEHDLERRFGAPYARYRTSVRCWIPALRPFETDVIDISTRGPR